MHCRAPRRACFCEPSPANPGHGRLHVPGTAAMPLLSKPYQPSPAARRRRHPVQRSAFAYSPGLGRHGQAHDGLWHRDGRHGQPVCKSRGWGWGWGGVGCGPQQGERSGRARGRVPPASNRRRIQAALDCWVRPPGAGGRGRLAPRICCTCECRSHVVLASQKVSPEAQSTPNMATMSPAAASWMSSSSSACMRTRRGTCGTGAAVGEARGLGAAVRRA